MDKLRGAYGKRDSRDQDSESSSSGSSAKNLAASSNPLKQVHNGLTTSTSFASPAGVDRVDMVDVSSNDKKRDIGDAISGPRGEIAAKRAKTETSMLPKPAFGRPKGTDYSQGVSSSHLRASSRNNVRTGSNPKPMLVPPQLVRSSPNITTEDLSAMGIVPGLKSTQPNVIAKR